MSCVLFFRQQHRGNMQPVWAGVSIASVLMVMIYSLGKTSGGHFNPAVSIMYCIQQNATVPLQQLSYHSILKASHRQSI
eukprot:3657203-Amphidinium_carterae.1